MKLILVRHGQTDWNKNRMTQGQSDTELNRTGVFQAKKVAAALKKENISYCYYSPLKRAKSTADIISDYLNIDSKADESLIELNFGLWEGMTLDQISMNYEQEFTNWSYFPHKVVIPQGENMEDALKRSKLFIDFIAANNRGNILVVSHGLLIKTLILAALNFELKDLQKFRVDNASINIIEFKGERRYLSKLNDTSHLYK